MRTQIIVFLLVLSLVVACTGCTTSVTMPYSSEEYENGSWELDELVEHFEELGFDQIDIDEHSMLDRENLDKNSKYITTVRIEDVSSDSWFTEYRDFDKGEEIGTYLEVKINVVTPIPVWSIDNCVELENIAKMDPGSAEQDDALKAFAEQHNGEYLEFYGLLTDWYDQFWYVGVSFAVSVENSNEMTFSWNSIDLYDLGMTGEYHYENYKTGLISEGDRVRILSQIEYTSGEMNLRIETFEVID